MRELVNNRPQHQEYNYYLRKLVSEDRKKWHVQRKYDVSCKVEKGQWVTELRLEETFCTDPCPSLLSSLLGRLPIENEAWQILVDSATSAWHCLNQRWETVLHCHLVPPHICRPSYFHHRIF